MTTLGEIFDLTEDAYVAALAWTWTLERKDPDQLRRLKDRALDLADGDPRECFDMLTVAILGLDKARHEARLTQRQPDVSLNGHGRPYGRGDRARSGAGTGEVG